jgi:hypothetical protein
MKRLSYFKSYARHFITVGLLFLCFSVSGQAPATVSPALPDSINTIATLSCMPCHSNSGGLFSRSKLNFEAWTEYTPDKQKESAAKIYSEVSEETMPPKSSRERSPEKIPAKEQIETIKRWSESFK